MTSWSILLITCLILLPALDISMDKPEDVRPAPGTCCPVMYLGIPDTSSEMSINRSNTAISSCALEFGWKKLIGGVESAKSDCRNCQIFHGYICVMSSPAGRRLIFTPTCGPEDMPILLASARAAALHMFWASIQRSATPLPSTRPGTFSNDVR